MDEPISGESSSESPPVSSESIGITVEQAAERLVSSMTPFHEETEAKPAEPSEDVEKTIEATEEVEEVEITEEMAEAESKVIETEDTSEIDTFLSDLNDHFREDTSHFDAIKIPTKVNGVEGEATLSELLATHQIGEASAERLESLKAEESAFKADRQQQMDAYSEQLNQAAALVQGLEKQFTDQFSQVDWNELRQTDPAEFAAKQQEKVQVEQQLGAYKTQIHESYNNQLNTQYQEILQRESGKILDRIPEWSDAELASKEKSGIREYLLTQEFDPSEIDGAVENGRIKSMGLVDSRLVKLARKAMLFDQGKKDVDLTTKKVKKLPKVAKPGKPEVQVDVNTKAKQARRAKLRKSGKLDDFAAILYDDLMEG